MTLRIIYDDANAGTMGTCLRVCDEQMSILFGQIDAELRQQFIERQVARGLWVTSDCYIAPGAIKKVLVVEDDPAGAPRVSESSHV